MCKLRLRLENVPYPYCLAINACVMCDGNDMNCNNFKEYNKRINQDNANNCQINKSK